MHISCFRNGDQYTNKNKMHKQTGDEQRLAHIKLCLLTDCSAERRVPENNFCNMEGIQIIWYSYQDLAMCDKIKNNNITSSFGRFRPSHYS